jgi:hypothetical protein
MLAGTAAWIAAPLTILGAALIGKSAVKDWRAEKVVSREIEAGESVLSAAYRARDAIDGIRARWTASAELQGAENALNEANAEFDVLGDDGKKAYVRRAVFYRRADYFKDDFNAVFDAIPLAKIYFGDEVEAALRNFPKARQRILSSADMLPMMVGPAGADDQAVLKQINRDLYGKWQEDDVDEVGALVTEGISKLERQILPKLKSVTK